ncbi:hypothetical protein BCR44DRAFT_1439552 [Catenaria anguillulae PL171]|uniref:Uncharacterized protein n=1 Tax=Catenaria anguillulae PL171 TaxID=765915 RepID=A0A1Y2HDX0_9FUNG|nr:hypothetical protein BCR44DRAFT_1439552 [Catenaria anguillulae PL171]
MRRSLAFGRLSGMQMFRKGRVQECLQLLLRPICFGLAVWPPIWTCTSRDPVVSTPAASIFTRFITPHPSAPQPQLRPRPQRQLELSPCPSHLKFALPRVPPFTCIPHESPSVSPTSQLLHECVIWSHPRTSPLSSALCFPTCIETRRCHPTPCPCDR